MSPSPSWRLHCNVRYDAKTSHKSKQAAAPNIQGLIIHTFPFSSLGELENNAVKSQALLPSLIMQSTLFSVVALCANLAAGAVTALQNGAGISSLDDAKWTVTNEHGNITVPGKFPSHVQLDLFAAGVIGKANN